MHVHGQARLSRCLTAPPFETANHLMLCKAADTAVLPLCALPQILAVSGFQLGGASSHINEVWMVQFYNHAGETSTDWKRAHTHELYQIMVCDHLFGFCADL